MFLCGYVPVLKTGLKYKLEKADSALVFQVLEQSADITAFLSRNHFMASNGYRVALSKYPEFKHSKNVIFLRGSDGDNDFKLDVTRFAGNMQRDNASDMFNQALKELVNTVKSASYAYPVKVIKASSYRKNILGCNSGRKPAKIIVLG
jgi:hypothetical protein